MTWEPPTEFEEYRIVRPLGAGTMGVVFLAHDTLLDRMVAIKFISALEVNPPTRERFLVEARAVARLSHPNVVAVHRVGEVSQRPYLVAEYARGTSLARVAKPIPWQRALKIGIGLARGLGAAHQRGVLHRDIKPANVMLGDDDEPKLLDFGLAKLVGARAEPQPAAGTAPSPSTPADATSRDHALDATMSIAAASAAPVSRAGHPTPVTVMPHTDTGAIIGTPLYLAPELWRGEPASPASDVYALGIVLYELLAGRPPHAGLAISELAVRVPAEDAAPIASQVASLPVRLAQLVDACARRDPALRPSSGDELCDLLEAIARTPPTLDGGAHREPAMSDAEPPATFDAGSSPEPQGKPDHTKPAIIGEHKVVAVLFSDLRGFASLSEGGGAAEVVEQLNQYFDRMVRAITAHGGTVDKFIGDAVLAVFGGAMPLASAAEAALDAALAMRLELRELNQQRKAAGLAPLDNGIGIDFGEVLYGSIGSADRKELTVLGDVVNTASLLEAVTKELQTPIVVSDAVAAALSPERRLGLTSFVSVKLKGRKQPVTVYGATGVAEGSP
ncbi:MAG TPA: protein kinase [Kofleriaceae bacterium]